MASPARLSVLRDGPVLVVGFAGGWGLRERLPQHLQLRLAADKACQPARHGSLKATAHGCGAEQFEDLHGLR